MFVRSHVRLKPADEISYAVTCVTSVNDHGVKVMVKVLD